MNTLLFTNSARIMLAILCCIKPALADEFEPDTWRFKVPAIASIAIKSQGANEVDTADERFSCAEFQLTQSDVGLYLHSARQISRRDYMHKIDYSSCSVQGSLKLKDGRTGRWLIQKLRGGTLSLSDGKSYYLYCPKCTSKKFAPS
jgi:hypothetical protein